MSADGSSDRAARWRLLPALLARLSGFSIARLEPLRLRRSVESLAVRDAALLRRQTIAAEVEAALSGLRFQDHAAFDDPERRPVLRGQLKQLRAFAQAGGVEPPTATLIAIAALLPAVGGAIDGLMAADRSLRAAEKELAELFAAELAASRSSLRRLYGDDERLREAVYLESPEAHERIAQLVTMEGPRTSRARQRERLAIMYAQRFCAKNDTNSMCGPHGLAFLDGVGAPRFVLRRELAHRETYFSHWAAELTARSLFARAGDPSLEELERNPTALLTGEDQIQWCVLEHDPATAFRRRYASARISGIGRRIVEALERPRSRRALAEALAADPEAADLDEVIAELTSAGLIAVADRVPVGLFRPLEHVRARLEAQPGLAASAAEVASLEQEVARFGGAPLDERITIGRRLSIRFAELTGQRSERGEGKHYVDRGLLHEDCHADVELVLGRETEERLRGALSLLVTAAGVTLEIAREQMRSWFRGRFGEGVAVPALVAHRGFDQDNVFATPKTTARARALEETAARIREVMAAAGRAATGGVVRVSSTELAAAVADLERGARPGYVSADVLLARRPEGAPLVVLGEVHGFFLMPTCLLDVAPGPAKERALAAMRGALSDLAGGGETAAPIFPHTRATDRRFALAASDLIMAGGSDRRAHPFGRLTLTLHGDDFVFLDGEQPIIPTMLYGYYPFFSSTSAVAPLIDDFAGRFFPDALLPDELRDGRSTPRLVLDDVVFRRAGATRGAAGVRDALRGDGELDLLARAQRLRADLGGARHHFVTIPGEPKPILLDFENLFLLEALLHLVEGAAEGALLRFSEMLPGPSELALEGPDGPRTSELRIGLYRLPDAAAPR